MKLQKVIPNYGVYDTESKLNIAILDFKRKHKMSYQQIADACQVKKEYVRKIVEKYAARTNGDNEAKARIEMLNKLWIVRK